jgi:hypothetical protein
MTQSETSQVLMALRQHVPLAENLSETEGEAFEDFGVQRSINAENVDRRDAFG